MVWAGNGLHDLEDWGCAGRQAITCRCEQFTLSHAEEGLRGEAGASLRHATPLPSRHHRNRVRLALPSMHSRSWCRVGVLPPAHPGRTLSPKLHPRLTLIRVLHLPGSIPPLNKCADEHPTTLTAKKSAYLHPYSALRYCVKWGMESMTVRISGASTTFSLRATLCQHEHFELRAQQLAVSSALPQRTVTSGPWSSGCQLWSGACLSTQDLQASSTVLRHVSPPCTYSCCPLNAAKPSPV